MADNENTEWGSKRTDYYSKNKRDKEDSDYIEEEEEAIRIQQKKLQKLREAKLLDSEDEGDNEGTMAKPKTIVKKAKKFNLDSSDDEATKAKTTDEDKEENEQVLRNLKINLEEVNENLIPIIEIFESKASIKGLTHYLKAKKDMHFLYSIYLAYYLHFKLKGGIPDHHPVVKKMLYVKSLLNNMTETDDSMANKIDDILKLIEQQGKAEGDEEEDEDDVEDSQPQLLGKKQSRDKKSILDVDLNDFIDQNNSKLLKLKGDKQNKLVKVNSILTI
jgi:hypothetical protein